MAQQHKFEDETLQIVGRVTKGRFNKKKDVKIIPIHDDRDQKGIDVTIADDQVKCAYKLPPVPDNVDFYRLTVAVEYAKFIGDGRRLLDVDVVVWPRKLKLKATSATSPGAAVGAAFAIEENGATFPVAPTNSSGLASYTFIEKDAGYAIRAKAPWEIIEEKRAAGKRREFELKVARRIKAKLVKPLPKSDPSPVVQYVNLATTDEGRDGLGSKVTLHVSGNGDPDLVPKKGDQIFIKVEFSRASKRNTPEPKLLSDHGVQEVTKSKPDGTEYTGWVALGEGGADAKFTVELGIAGGDTCTVRVGGTKSASDQSLTFVNWRRLYYELRFPRSFIPRLAAKTLPDGTDGHDYPETMAQCVKTRLAEVFVEYQLVKSHVYEDADAPAGTWFPPAFLQTAGTTPLLTFTSGWVNKSAGFSSNPDLLSRTVYVNLCDRSFSDSDSEQAQALVLTSADQVKALALGTPSKYFFPRRPKDGSAGLVVAGFEWVADIAAGAAAAPAAIEWETPDAPLTEDAREGYIRVVERHQNRSVELAFSKVGSSYTTAPDAEANEKLETFLASLYTDIERLRGNGVKFAIVGISGSPADASRFNQVKAKVVTYHTTQAPKLTSHPGRDAAGQPRKGPMDVAWLTLETFRKIRVKLPDKIDDKPGPGAFVGAASATQCPVNVAFKVWGSTSINGNAGKGLQLMVLKETEPGCCAATICHELGHSMGMTTFGDKNSPHPSDLPAPKHVDQPGGTYYFDSKTGPYTNGIRNLHRGPHCAKGVPESKKSHAKFDGWSPTDPDNSCIMWGSGGSDDVRQHFCDVCSPLIRARRLEDIRSLCSSRTP